MEIEDIARKLKPLMPEKVDRWLRSRASGGPEMKLLMEQHIVNKAQKHLGDYRNKILLSLPSRGKVEGAINLGTVLYEEEKWGAGISKDELLKHVAIFGMHGTGKYKPYEKSEKASSREQF